MPISHSDSECEKEQDIKKLQDKKEEPLKKVEDIHENVIQSGYEAVFSEGCSLFQLAIH